MVGVIIGVVSLVVSIGALIAVFVVKAQLKEEISGHTHRQIKDSDGKVLFGESFYNK